MAIALHKLTNIRQT